MKKGLFALTAIAGILLAGCAAPNESPTPAPTVTVTERVTPPAPEPVETTPAKRTGQQVTDAQFEQFVRDTIPELDDVPRAILVDFAKSVCFAKSQGKTTDDLLGIIADQGHPLAMSKAFAKLAGASVPMYCIEYLELP